MKFFKYLRNHECQWEDIAFWMEQCSICSRTRKKPTRRIKRRRLTRLLMDCLV